MCILILPDIFMAELPSLKGLELCDTERCSPSPFFPSFTITSVPSLIKMGLYVPEGTLSATFVISIDAVLKESVQSSLWSY